jgi:hypothetical protein
VTLGVFFGIVLTAVATFNLVDCTVFAKQFECERVLHLLVRHKKQNDPVARLAAQQTVLEYRLRVVPVWLLASVFSWAWLIFELIAKQ